MIVEYDDFDVRYKAKESDQWTAVGIDELILNYEDKRWIPTSERLPEEDGYYIVAFRNGWIPNDVISIDILLYEGGKWKYYFVFDDDDDFESPITAWMPLPEPYKGGDAE